MKTYQLEIKEVLCMTIEIEAKSVEQADAMARKAYRNENYILNAEHFTGVDFTTREKEMDTKNKKQKHHGQVR